MLGAASGELAEVAFATWIRTHTARR